MNITASALTKAARAAARHRHGVPTLHLGSTGPSSGSWERTSLRLQTSPVTPSSPTSTTRLPTTAGYWSDGSAAIHPYEGHHHAVRLRP